MDSSIAPTGENLKVLNMQNDEFQDLVRHAEESDAADKQLTVREALKRYKTATFWAMILSTSLIMEGFDLVTVSLSAEPSCTSSQGPIYPNLNHIDQLVLWSTAISKSLWNPSSWLARQESHIPCVAVWPLQLCTCRSTSRSHHQPLHSRQIWLQNNHDVLHGMDGPSHLCPLFCSFTLCPCFR